MFYSYGGCYRGQWQDDLKHGTGLMEFRDGRSYDGEWDNGKVLISIDFPKFVINQSVQLFVH